MSSPHESPRQRLRDLLAGDRCITMGSVYDPMSARIAEDIGYEAALMGGSLASHALLAAPDLILITLTELAEQVGRCTRVSGVPIVVDGDHGYGNALNVARAIEELDRAGAAAVTIEDTDLPRPFGPSGKASLLPLQESVGKIRAAVRARGSAGPLIFGRTSAANLTTVEDAIERFKAYEQEGVDALFIPGLASREDLDRISASTHLPLLLGGASGDVGDIGYLASRRVRAWSGGHQVFAVAIAALHQAMSSVFQGTVPSALPGIAPKAMMDRLLHAAQYDAMTRDTLQ